MHGGTVEEVAVAAAPTGECPHPRRAMEGHAYWWATTGPAEGTDLLIPASLLVGRLSLRLVNVRGSRESAPVDDSGGRSSSKRR